MSKNNKNDLGKGAKGSQSAKPDVSRASDADIQKAHDALLFQKEAPKTGFSPVPIFFIFLTSAVILIVAIYMVWNSDDFDPLGYDDTRRRFAWETTEAGEGPDPFLRMGQQVYGANCTACHQADGMGLPGAFPPLVGTETVLEQEERLIRTVMHGLEGPVEVLGQSYNSAMPNLGLNDEQIAAVLTHIRQSWENDAEPISPDDVSRIREEEVERGPWTDEELQQFGN